MVASFTDELLPMAGLHLVRSNFTYVRWFLLELRPWTFKLVFVPKLVVALSCCTMESDIAVEVLGLPVRTQVLKTVRFFEVRVRVEAAAIVTPAAPTTGTSNHQRARRIQVIARAR